MANHPNRGNANRPGRSPTPAEVRAERERAGMTQTQAAHEIYCSLRTWQGWEEEESAQGHRRMHAAMWELWLLKTARRRAKRAAGLQAPGVPA